MNCNRMEWDWGWVSNRTFVYPIILFFRIPQTKAWFILILSRHSDCSTIMSSSGMEYDWGWVVLILQWMPGRIILSTASINTWWAISTLCHHSPDNWRHKTTPNVYTNHCLMHFPNGLIPKIYLEFIEAYKLCIQGSFISVNSCDCILLISCIARLRFPWYLTVEEKNPLLWQARSHWYHCVECNCENWKPIT